VELERVVPTAGTLAMEPLENGYWRVEAPGMAPGGLYRYRMDGRLSRPDPASHHQPQDVHGPSAVVDHAAFAWSDHGFTPPGLAECILYELHIGTFTPEGTFDAAILRLDDLAGLGVTALEIMPVGQFPGSRNWGYDGVYPFSVQHSYGGPHGLKRFVDACHAQGLAVILDLVYNHLGPEGNYLRDFGPYFSDRYKTPWGEAVNFDGPESDHVRHYFLQNALHWLDRYHIDGFRLDATHAIHDQRPKPFMRELADLVRGYATARGRSPLILAENNLNDPRLALPVRQGGLGLPAIFSEDFHHGVHTLLTGEKRGYYCDYGRMEHLAKALATGFAYTGEYSVFHRRSQGQDPGRLPPEALAAFIQNHDQVGNRAHGERLAALVPFEALKAAAGLLLLAPYTPLLFMGEEYGEDRPFLYFISHIDPGLVEAVRAGRKVEFAGFHQSQPPPPDPQDEQTFRRSVLEWEKRYTGRHGLLLGWYKELIRLRATRLRPAGQGRKRPAAFQGGAENVLIVRGKTGGQRLLYLCNLSARDRPVTLPRLRSPKGWEKELDSAETRWGGPGSAMPGIPSGQAVLRAWSFTLYCPREASG